MQKRRAAGEIILIDGASSSGKTTISRALQETLDQPFWHSPSTTCAMPVFSPSNAPRPGTSIGERYGQPSLMGSIDVALPSPRPETT
jgi:guanylate kinase